MGRLLAVVAVVAFVGWSVTTSAFGGAARFTSFVGVYQAQPNGQNAQIIDRAIHDGTASMGPLRRSVARRRLHAVNKPYRVLRISIEGANLVTDFDGKRYVAPLDGTPQRGTDPEGKRVDVSYEVESSGLHARYAGDDGQKEMVFVSSPDGHRLALRVVLRSGRLPEPIRYELSFVRR